MLLIFFCLIALTAIGAVVYQWSSINKKNYYHFDIYNEAAHTVIYAPVSDELPNPNVIWAGENKLPGYVKDPVNGLEYKVVGIGRMSFNYGDYFSNNNKDSKPPVVIIPETIEFIDEAAFIYCSHIESLSLPASLKRIERWAFYGNTSLTSIYSHSVEPPQLADVVFMGTYDYDTKTYHSFTETCTLYVPSGSENAYKDWGGYKWKAVKALPG